MMEYHRRSVAESPVTERRVSGARTSGGSADFPAAASPQRPVPAPRMAPRPRLARRAAFQDVAVAFEDNAVAFEDNAAASVAEDDGAKNEVAKKGAP